MSPAESADGDGDHNHDGFPLDPDELGSAARKNWLDRPWVWPLFGLIGLLVFELTTNPGLAVAVFCVKLGMGDVRLGLWLARNDPQRERGTITGLMAASLIGIKITLASLVILLVILIVLLVMSWTVLGNAGQNQAVIGQCAQSLAITSAVAVSVSLAIARLGFYQARRAGQKVWLESSMRRAPIENVWPLDCVGHTPRNMVIDVAQFCFLLQIPLIIAVVMLIAAIFPATSMWALGAGLILQILSYVHLRITIWKVAARHPGECWPELLETQQFRYFDGLRYQRATRPVEVEEEADEV